ncbi:MAG TPA: phosphatase PAP2 family protein [Actinocrinis sp.]|nr:phosphatase PAP2 family protein [Actinocrinis sp.]
MSKLSEPDTRPSAPARPAPAPAPVRWWLYPAMLVGGFLLLLWQVTSRGPVTTLDDHVRNVIQGVATTLDPTWLVPAGHGLADLGDPPLCVPVLLAAVVAATVKGRTWRPVAVFGGAVGMLVLVAYFKISVNRPGPGQYTAGRTNRFNAGPGNASYGPGLANAGQGWGYFPSGHTADSMICIGTAAILLTSWVFTGARQRAWATWIVATWVSLVMIGLLWSNYHWLSDLVGSLCLCGAALMVFYRFCASGRRPRAQAAEPPSPDPADAAGGGLR